MTTIKLEETIGLPPGSSSAFDNPMINSMPVATIVPGEPKLQKSAAVFQIVPKFKKYAEMLGEYGYSLSSKKLKVAFIADNFPTDSFSNQYGPSFLENMMNIGPAGLGQLSQMAGAKSATEMVKNIASYAEENSDIEIVKKAMGTIGSGSEKVGNALKNMKKKGGIVVLLMLH